MDTCFMPSLVFHGAVGLFVAADGDAKLVLLTLLNLTDQATAARASSLTLGLGSFETGVVHKPSLLFQK